MRVTTRNPLTVLAGLALVPALLTGCGEDDVRATAPAAPVPAAPASSAALPDAVDATEASATTGPLWGAYLTATEGYDPTAADATAATAAKALGYDASSGELGCDRGAPEALGLDPTSNYWSTSLLFRTEADARAFVDAYEPEVVGIARITVGCND